MTQDEYREVERIRLGRNFVRVGDRVRVAPSRKYGRDGFRAATVTALFLHRYLADHGGEDEDLTRCASWCAQVRISDPRTGASRTFFLDRVSRRSQTKVSS